MGGRRGELSLIYEVGFSLLFVVLFAYVTISYILSHANGDLYFSRMYTKDVAAAADAVNSGAGDVILRYDNIKEDNRLSFWLQNGMIQAARPGTVSDKTNQAPTGAPTAYYGKAKSYVGDSYLDTPTFLVLRKAGGAFGISSAETSMQECPTAEHQVTIDQARVYLQAPQEAQDIFSQVLKPTPITLSPQDQANILISVTRSAGNENSVTCGPTNPEGAALCCLIAQQLGAVSAASFTSNQPTTNQGPFTLDITLTKKTDTLFTDEQLGRALAYALAVHYR